MRKGSNMTGRAAGLRQLRHWAGGTAGFLVGAAVLGAAEAANFKSAPKADESGGGGGGPDTILGIVHINTAFFIAVGVIAFVWFLFGGGRKPKVGRKGF